MGKKRIDRRRVRAKKETLRNLDQHAIPPQQLEQVAGGAIYVPKKISCPCDTSC